MTNKFASIFFATLVILGLSKTSDAAIVFSAISKNVAVNSTSIATEIRVTGVGAESLQYFSITANLVPVSLGGGRTISFTNATRDGSATIRSTSDYLLNDRGTHVTGVGTSFAIDNSATSVSFRDGVSVGTSPNPGAPSTGVAPGSSGRLIATLVMNVSGTGLGITDSYRIDLTALASNANAFTGAGPTGLGDLAFAGGAATGRTDTVVGSPISATFASGTITAVPEPSTFAMLGLAFGIFGAAKFRKRLSKLVC